MEFTCGDGFYQSLHLSPSLSQHFSDLEKREIEVALIDESREIYHRRESVGTMELQYEGFEFCPVEHPMEPQDEDRPVKCPLPASSLINDGKVQQQRVGDGFCTRPEILAELAREPMVRARAAPVRAVRKRQHTVSSGQRPIQPPMRMASLPPLPSHSITIFQMLQEFDKFES